MAAVFRFRRATAERLRAGGVSLGRAAAHAQHARERRAALVGAAGRFRQCFALTVAVSRFFWRRATIGGADRAVDMINENDQAERAISTGKLNALLRLHTQPINVVVFHGSSGRTRFEVGFPLRCLQRLSRPYIATLHCGWRHNRSTRGTSTPVLSY